MPKEKKNNLQKNIGKKIRKNFTAKVKSLDEDDGTLEAVVATVGEDRHGEILDINGLDLGPYKENPVVAWAHKYDEPPIAQTLNIRKTHDGKLVAKMKFAKDEYPFAEQIYKLYKGRYLRAFSIGFIPKEVEDNRYTKSEMLEYSGVLIPANAEALTLAIKNGIDVETVKKKTKGEKVKKKKVKKKKGGKKKEDKPVKKSPTCRLEDETEQECINRKVPEILEERPDMEQDQAVAIAASMCETLCSEQEEIREQEEEEQVDSMALFKYLNAKLKEVIQKNER